MDEFTLKDGRPARLEVWNLEELEAYASQELEIEEHDNYEKRVYEGFKYFDPGLFYRMKEFDPAKDYSVEEELSPLEEQLDPNLRNTGYHRAIVAFHEETLCGVLVCQWIKRGYSFWHYHIQYVDVRKDYKNIGIGTALIRALDQSEFLKAKILLIGMFSEDGKKYMKQVIKRELKAENYARISEYYDSDTPPTDFGVYTSPWDDE